MKFTKLEAIQEMAEIGSHTIILESEEQLVNDICEPFGITPRWSTFRPEKRANSIGHHSKVSIVTASQV